MSNKKVGVVMSYWKNDNPVYLENAIQSIIQQSKKIDSFILVRDGPVSDNLLKVASKFSEKGFLKEYILKLNKGRGFARDYGIKLCKCDFIAIMDSDDISNKDRIKLQSDYLQSNNSCSIVGGYIQEFDKSNSLVKKRIVPITHNEIIKKGKLIQPFNHVTIMFKRDCYLKTSGYGTYKYIEDYNLYFNFYIKGYIFHNLKKVLVNVRLPDKGIRKTNFNYLIEELKLQFKMYKNKYINLLQLLINIFNRLVFRALPLKLKLFITNKFLRNF